MGRRSYRLAQAAVFLLVSGSVASAVANQRKDPEQSEAPLVSDQIGVRDDLAVGKIEVVLETMVEETAEEPAFWSGKDWNDEECYLLAKIAMAEAENQDAETKKLVIKTVLNRVSSEKFPDNIHDVIFEKTGRTYQFSCIGNGRWDAVEPDETCWDVMEMVRLERQDDDSEGALYFEACRNEDNWHSRNLDFLYQSGDIRFYR
nr:MAG TPA: Cell Wall Hydrolase [Caudoviricetes sp.]